MTVNTSDITSGPYSGNDVTTEFTYDFRVELKTQLTVYETDDVGVVTELTVDTDYTVAGIGNDAGGTLTRVAGALPTGYTWYIRANYQPTQDTDLDSQGGFFPDVHEAALDKLTFLHLQQQDQINRSFKLPDSYSGGASAELPIPVALKFLRWNATGDALELVSGVTSVIASDVTFAPTGDISATDVQSAIEELDTEKAPLASPGLTGTPTAPTATAGTSTDQLATTSFVGSATGSFKSRFYDLVGEKDNYLFVMTGQSNADLSRDSGGPHVSNSNVKVWDITAGDFVVADLENTTYTTDMGAGDTFGNGDTSAAIAFADRVQTETGANVYVIINAKGGASITNWDTGTYTTTLKSTIANAIADDTAPAGLEVDILFWLQGEIDLNNGMNTATYSGHFENFVTSMDSETYFDKTTTPIITAPVNDDYIETNALSQQGDVQVFLRGLYDQNISQYGRTYVADVSFLKTFDGAHYKAYDQVVLGRDRFAQAIMVEPQPEVIQVWDKKDTGVESGSLTATDNQTRDLNYIAKNTIRGADLNSNRISLPKGVYRVDGYTMGHRVDRTTARLYNVTDSFGVADGNVTYSPSSTAGANAMCRISGEFTILEDGAELELQQSCQTARATNGGGPAFGTGDEIYSDLIITKLRDV